MEQNKALKSQKGIKNFIEQNKWPIFVTFIILIIAYGMKVFHLAISHDTEAIINVPESLYNSWLTMGRFGLIAIKKLFDLYIFNPYIAAVFMFIMMLINSVLWEFLFWKLCDRPTEFSKRSWIFPALFFSAPVMAEQQVFLLQSFEIEVAVFLVGIALLLFWQASEATRKMIYYIIIFLALAIAFSCYQAMLPLFIAGAVATIMLKLERNQAGWKEAFQLIGCFAGSFLLYEIVNKIIMSCLKITTTAYISDQILWGKVPVKECIKNILRHVANVLTGQGVYYSVLFTVSIILLVCLIIYKRRKVKHLILFILACLVLLGSPFLMTLLLGQAPTYRTQIILPFVYGFIIQYAVGHIRTDNIPKRCGYFWAAAGVILCFGVKQSMDVSRMYYTEYVQYEEDVRLAVKISDRIDQLNLGEIPEEPVVFIGSRSPQLNRSSDRQYEITGHSFFEWAFTTQHGTFIMENFMATIGYTYHSPSAEQITRAEAYAADMEAWPNTGSVQVKDGIIIVKLSDIS